MRCTLTGSQVGGLIVVRVFSRFILALALAALACSSTRAASAARRTLAEGTLQIVATVGGQPDDITTDTQGRLVWGDLARGTVERLDGGRVTTLAAGLALPEGIVVLPTGAIVVAEQGRDRIVRIDRNGARTVLDTLQPVPGQEGVDGIGRDPHSGELLIPDAPRGTVLSVGADGRHARVIARGLGRPVAAALNAHGDILVPDEHLGTLVVISPQGTIRDEGALSTPDDVAIAPTGRVWITTLGDGGLWTIDPGARTPYRVLTGLSNPQGLTLDRCGDPVVVDQNTARIVRWLLTPTAARCPF